MVRTNHCPQWSWPEEVAKKQGNIGLCMFPAQFLHRLRNSGRSKPLRDEKGLSFPDKGNLGELFSIFGFMGKLLCPEEWTPGSGVLHR